MHDFTHLPGGLTTESHLSKDVHPFFLHMQFVIFVRIHLIGNLSVKTFSKHLVYKKEVSLFNQRYFIFIAC